MRKIISFRKFSIALVALLVITSCKDKNSSLSSLDNSESSASLASSASSSSSSSSSSSASNTSTTSETTNSSLSSLENDESSSNFASSEGSASSESSTSNTSSTSTTSETTSTSTSEVPPIDWSIGNAYYSSLQTSNDVIGDLARLLRSTLQYQTYGDARYNYAKDSKTNFQTQYVLYETTGLSVPLSWGDGGYVNLPTGSPQAQLKIEREHIWPQSNMQIRPVGSSTNVSTFPTYELDSDSSFYKKSVSNTWRGHRTDWHNLWNCVGSWNGSHGNRFYGGPSIDHSQVSPGNLSGGWYPGAEYVGDVARAVFYMTLTYPFLTLVDSSSSHGEGSIYYGHLDYL